MNTPRVRPLAAPTDIADAAEYAAYPVRSASFVSVLVRADAVWRLGLPIADYFLWNDDFEYTTRILRQGRGYLVRTSIVRHHTKTFGATDADPGPRFYLEVRNKVWLLTRSRSLSPLERALYGGSTLRRWWRTFAKSGDRRVLASGLWRGLRDGLSAAPRGNADVLADLAPELVAGQRELAAPRPVGPARPAGPMRPASPAAPVRPAGFATGPAEFSVLLPVYAGDRAEHFHRAVRSVTIEQQRRPDELVIVQDGPVPSALAAAIEQTAQTCPVPVAHHRLARNAGLTRALSAGLAACRFDVIARMDADDISLPERFARQLPLIEAGADLVGTGMYEFVEKGRITAQRIPPIGEQAIAAYATFHDPFNHPTVVYRRSAVELAGGYRDLPLMEDYWLFARMIEHGACVANLPEPLVAYRVDDGAYDRRGGWRLCVSELRLQREFLRSRFVTPAQFVRNVLIRGGYRFVPVGIRKALYQRRFARPAARVEAADRPLPHLL